MKKMSNVQEHPYKFIFFKNHSKQGEMTEFH